MPDAPHQRVHNPRLYQDRTVQDWHYDNMTRQAKAIDLDLYGYCSCCYEPLYLVEASTNPDKATNALMGLAVRVQAPAFLVLHHQGRVVGGRELTRSLTHPTPEAVRTALAMCRFTHTARQHPHQVALLRQLERDLP